MDSPWFILFAGFSLYLAQRTYCQDINCGSHYTSKTGSFSSPGHPSQYRPNLFCVWTVRVTGSNPEITLTFRSQGTFMQSGTHIGQESDKQMNVFFILNKFSAITTSQATAGIVAAIFCGIVFLGVGAMRCVMMGACQRCQNETPENRECVGTHETVSNYVMDCPPSYRTVMEHPERFPTPNITPHISPTSTPRASHYCEQNEVDDDDSEPPPPYSRVVPLVQDIDTAGTSGRNAQEIHVDVERTINPVNSNIETVIIHNNPREAELTDTETERPSANRRNSYSIASCENPVLSPNPDLQSLEELDSDNNNDRCNDRQSTGMRSVDPRNTRTGDSNGSISIMDDNNEPICNHDNEPNDIGCRSTVAQITEPPINGYISGRGCGGPRRDHSTQTDAAISRRGYNV
ncbi:uncharacterized protein LOC116296263 [Actinia tenebrosa]|uniref:Uncharacterized protein LOC116296263 n=1 Tax=Actinia tenebrosa TaxID=6105 RepID=A0A6P8I5W9_ACTTE|nr:uncharacterized protein LOC116296263 [Actinia tenebrosa]